MRAWIPIAASVFLFLTGCDPNRATRPIQVVATPELVARQSCQALVDAERKPQDEVVLTGTAEHGHPDLLHIACDGKEHTVIFMLMPSPGDLGMKELRRQWQKKTSSQASECPSCPRYNVRARFVGMLRADPAESTRLLYLVRTADQIHKLRIQHAGSN
jgi:hypothetical protein